jgi:hypothetical protein
MRRIKQTLSVEPEDRSVIVYAGYRNNISSPEALMPLAPFRLTFWQGQKIRPADEFLDGDKRHAKGNYP